MEEQTVVKDEGNKKSPLLLILIVILLLSSLGLWGYVLLKGCPSVCEDDDEETQVEEEETADVEEVVDDNTNGGKIVENEDIVGTYNCTYSNEIYGTLVEKESNISFEYPEDVELAQLGNSVNSCMYDFTYKGATMSYVNYATRPEGSFPADLNEGYTIVGTNDYGKIARSALTENTEVSGMYYGEYGEMLEGDTCTYGGYGEELPDRQVCLQTAFLLCGTTIRLSIPMTLSSDEQAQVMEVFDGIVMSITQEEVK